MSMVSTLRRGCLTLLVVPALGCYSYGGGNEPNFSAGLDIHGASNTPCIVTLRNGGISIDFVISTPTPLVADTSLAPRAAVSQCNAFDDAGESAAVTSPAGETAVAFRTSTSLCISQPGGHLMTALGFTATSEANCPVTLTLTCGGVVLYDAVPWQVCRFLG